MTREPATVKVSLESVGLTLSNVPPHFALHQPEAENDGSPSLQDGFVFISDVGSEDSGSIVVLGNTSLDMVQMQALAKYDEIQQKSMAIDTKGLTANLTASEIDNMLTEVLQQNFRFKETLGQTILTTKKVLTIIASKQEEVSKVHEEHKRQFAETKTLVNVLRAENNEYKNKIEELNRECANRSMQTEAQKDEGTASMVLNEKAAETEIKRLMEKSEKQDQENERMHTVIASLEQRLESDRKEREELSRVHEEQKRKFAETEKLVNVLRTEANEYKMKIEELNKKSTNRSMQTESHNGSTASMGMNEKAGEPEVTKLMEKCEKQDQENTRMHTVISSLEQRLESDRKEREEFSRVHEEQKRKFEKAEKLVDVLRIEADKYKMKIEELNKASTIRFMQTEAHNGSTASMAMNEKAGEPEVTKLMEKCEQQNREIARMRAVIASLERQLESTNEAIAGKAIQEFQPTPVPQLESQLKDVQTMLENMRRSREQIMLDLERERGEMARERTRLREDERKLVEANVSLHEETAAIRESNEVLRTQLAVYESDWTEQKKLCDTMRRKENELLELVEQLEEEKNQLLETMRYLEDNPNA